jgi:hypothetical protein
MVMLVGQARYAIIGWKAMEIMDLVFLRPSDLELSFPHRDLL